MAAPVGLTLELHERQSEAFHSTATEILYGGAAGGGKSHLMRVAAIAWCVGIPGLQVYLFRRESPDLWKNHMLGPGSFPVLLAPWIQSGAIRVNEQKGFLRFPNGSQINLCHCQYEKDKYGYHGAEIHVLMMDELTTFTATQYSYLRSRVRLGGLQVPAEFGGRFPRVVNGTNPGNVGHNWVKAAFVDPKPPLEIWKTPKDEGGMLRQYIPAQLEDNPTLLENDPEYENRLEGIGSPELVKAMRHGIWDIVAGGMFDDVWGPNVVLEPFSIPRNWHVDRCFDWGSSKPFAAYVCAESNGEEVQLVDGTWRTFPRGSVFLVGEEYGWNGKPNEGLRLTDAEIAKRILEMEAGLRLAAPVRVGPADSAIYAVTDGESTAQRLERAGLHYDPAAKGPGSRVSGWQKMREMLKAAKEGDREKPGLYVFNRCRQFLRTVPTLPRDEKKPDDVDTDAEDHAADAVRYRITAERHSEQFGSLLV